MPVPGVGCDVVDFVGALFVVVLLLLLLDLNFVDFVAGISGAVDALSRQDKKGIDFGGFVPRQAFDDRRRLLQSLLVASGIHPWRPWWALLKVCVAWAFRSTESFFKLADGSQACCCCSQLAKRGQGSASERLAWLLFHAGAGVAQAYLYAKSGPKLPPSEVVLCCMTASTSVRALRMIVGRFLCLCLCAPIL